MLQELRGSKQAAQTEVLISLEITVASHFDSSNEYYILNYLLYFLSEHFILPAGMKR